MWSQASALRVFARQFYVMSRTFSRSARLVRVVYVRTPFTLIFSKLNIHTYSDPSLREVASRQVTPAMLGIIPLASSTAASTVVEASNFFLFTIVRIESKLSSMSKNQDKR